MCVLLSVVIHCLATDLYQQLVLGSLSTTTINTLLILFGILLVTNDDSYNKPILQICCQ